MSKQSDKAKKSTDLPSTATTSGSRRMNTRSYAKAVIDGVRGRIAGGVEKKDSEPVKVTVKVMDEVQGVHDAEMKKTSKQVEKKKKKQKKKQKKKHLLRSLLNLQFKVPKKLRRMLLLMKLKKKSLPLYRLMKTKTS